MASNTKRIMGNQKRMGPGTTAYQVELQGFNVLMEHFWALAQMTDTFFPSLLDVASDIGIELAQELVPYSSITEEGHVHTRDSINKTPGVMHNPRGDWSVRYGPTTFYAPFLEYGTRFMEPRPFMIPSGDLAEKVMVASVMAFLNLFNTNDGGSGFGGGNVDAGRALHDPRIRSSIGGVRSLLYSQAKFLGDVAVFGGRGIIGPARARMYFLAKALGDVSSVIQGTINTRLSHRLSGRATGHLVGFGSASLSYGKTYSAFPGGAGGRRVYQRTVGRATNFGASGAGLGSLGSG